MHLCRDTHRHRHTSSYVQCTYLHIYIKRSPQLCFNHTITIRLAECGRTRNPTLWLKSWVIWSCNKLLPFKAAQPAAFYQAYHPSLLVSNHFPHWRISCPVWAQMLEGGLGREDQLFILLRSPDLEESEGAYKRQSQLSSRLGAGWPCMRWSL